MAAVVLKLGVKVERTVSMGGPRGASKGGVVDNTKLACRVQGVGGEVKSVTMKAVPGRQGGVGSPRAEVGKGKLGVAKEVVPTVGGESEVGRSKCSDEMIFGCADVPLCGEGAVVIGGGVLNVKGVGAEQGGKGFGGFVVDLQSCDHLVTSFEERQR